MSQATIIRTRGAGWLRLQLLLFSASAAVWFPALGGRSGSEDAGGDLLTWFGLPLLLLLAANAAWRLHQAGKASAPLAGLGTLAGSALALEIWITPHTALEADEGVRFLAVLQLAFGVLLIALQFPQRETINTTLRHMVRKAGGRAEVRERGPDHALAPPAPAPPAALRAATIFLNVCCALGLALNTLGLAVLAFLAIRSFADSSGDLAGNAIMAGLVVTQAVIELAMLRLFTRWAGSDGRLAPPALLLLAAVPALLFFGSQPAVFPLETGVSATVSLLGGRWYLRVRRSHAAGNVEGDPLSTRRRPGIHTPFAAVDEHIGSAAKPWSPTEIWGAYIVIPILLYGLSFVLGFVLYLAGAGDAVRELGMIEAEFLVLWVVLLYLVRRKGHPWSILGIRPFSLRSLLLVPLASAAQFAGVFVFNASLLPLLPPVQEYQASLEPYVEPSSATLFLLFFSLVVMAPVVEELLFRGFFFTGFRAYLSPAAAAILSALLFSLIHTFPIFFPFSLNLHPSQALGAFLGGLVFAGLRHDTDSIFPPMLAHAVWNLWVII